MSARCRLMVKEPFYGHIAMDMVWKESQMNWLPENRRTMGVRILSTGQVECQYYKPFVESLKLEELYAIVQHEIEHVVRLHCVRIGDRDQELWNIVADMTVNGRKMNPRIGYRDPNTHKIVIPFEDYIYWIPDKWPEDGTTEQFYEFLKKAEGKKKNKTDKRLLDDHTIWNHTEISHDEARQIVKDIVAKATEKSQGNIPGHLISAINQLSKPIVQWRQMLRQYWGRYCGNKRTTFSRRNRRMDWFGMPGISHHATARANIIVDTSGSVTLQYLEQFFSEIDMISSRVKTKILQWDSDMQGYSDYRRGDWKKFQVKGRGGTDMQAPLVWLKDNKLITDLQIMLTDGECIYPSADEVKFPIITVITSSTNPAPEYGHVVRMGI